MLDLERRQLSVFAGFEVDKLQGADRGSDQLFDFASDCFEHAADLAIASFSDGQLDGAGVHSFHFGGLRRAVF